MPLQFVPSITAATEVVAFQGTSRLAMRLTAMFRDVCDYRDSLSGGKNKIKQVVDYAAKVMGRDFAKIVKEEVGFTITAISFSTSPCGFFAIMPMIGNVSTTIINSRKGVGANTGLSDVLIKLSQGTYGKLLTKDEIIELYKTLDLLSGEVTQPTSGEFTYPESLSCAMFFDPYMAFLPKETINVTLEYTLPEEIAAVEMHEIGHFISMLEMCGNQYRVFEAIKSIQYNVVAQNDPELSAWYLDWVAKRTEEESRDAETLKEIDRKTADAIATEKDENNSSLDTNVTDVLRKFRILLMIVSLGRCNPFLLLVKLIWKKIIGKSHLFNRYGTGKKTSDLLHTQMENTLLERYADQYVVRHGMGAYTITALEKLHTAFMLMGILGSASGGILRTSKAAYYLVYTFNVILYTAFSASDEYSIYEGQNDRGLRARQEMVKLLQNPLVPDQIQREILHQISFVDAEMARRNAGSKILVLTHQILNVVERHFSIGAIVHEMVNGKLAVEYKTLQNRIERLVSNRLFELATRLRLTK